MRHQVISRILEAEITACSWENRRPESTANHLSNLLNQHTPMAQSRHPSFTSCTDGESPSRREGAEKEKGRELRLERERRPCRLIKNASGDGVWEERANGWSGAADEAEPLSRRPRPGESNLAPPHIYTPPIQFVCSRFCQDRAHTPQHQSNLPPPPPRVPNAASRRTPTS